MRTSLAACVLFLAAAHTALGDIGLSTSVWGMAALCSDTGTSSAQCSFSGTETNPGDYPYVNYGTNVTAYASFGYLAADIDAQSSLRHLGTSRANSMFTDTLSVTGSGSGFVQYELTVNRDFATWFQGYDIYLTHGMSSPDHFTTGSCCKAGDNHGTVVYQSGLFPVLFGSSFDLSVASSAQVWLEEGESGYNHLQISLTGLQVYDSSMNLISATVSSQSGTVYPTPEPASVILLLTTACILFAIFVRLKSSRLPHKFPLHTQAPGGLR